MAMNGRVWTLNSRFYCCLKSDKHLMVSKCVAKQLALTSRCISSKSLAANECTTDLNKQNTAFVGKCLQKAFGLRETQIATIYDNFPNVKTIDIKSLQNICSFLQRKQLCIEEIATKRTWILTTDKLSLTSGIKELAKSRLIEGIVNGKSYQLAVFLLPKQRFQAVCKRMKKCDQLFSDFDRRCDYICYNLDINCEEFCSLVQRNAQLIQIDFERIHQMMQLLKDNLVPNQDIVSDIWVFNHNFELMKQRIRECHENDYPIKTWTFRCRSDVWYPLLDRFRQNRDVLEEYSDKRQYLMNRLSLDDQSIETLVYRCPRILTVGSKKLDQIITLLYELGYNCNDIINCPRVLCYSLDRITKRLANISMNQMKKLDLNVILLSEESFKTHSKTNECTFE